MGSGHIGRFLLFDADRSAVTVHGYESGQNEGVDIDKIVKKVAREVAEEVRKKY
jgi:hypothetical protein